MQIFQRRTQVHALLTMALFRLSSFLLSIFGPLWRFFKRPKLGLRTLLCIIRCALFVNAGLPLHERWYYPLLWPVACRLYRRRCAFLINSNVWHLNYFHFLLRAVLKVPLKAPFKAVHLFENLPNDPVIFRASSDCSVVTSKFLITTVLFRLAEDPWISSEKFRLDQ